MRICVNTPNSKTDAGPTEPNMNPENETESPETRETDAERSASKPSSADEIAEEHLDQVAGGLVVYSRKPSPFDEEPAA